MSTLLNLAYEGWVQLARLFNWRRWDAYYVVIVGGPGAGKGTIAAKLAPRLDVPHFNMGNFVRREITGKTPRGLKWEATVKAGGLIPDEEIDQLLTSELRKPQYYRGAVCEGVCRTKPQAKTMRNRLAWWGNRVDVVVFLDVTEEALIERLSLRRTCSNSDCGASFHLKFHPPAKENVCDHCGSPLIEREDQKPDALKRRLAEFNREFEPVRKYYEEQGILVHVVSTNEMTPDQVYEEVLFEIDSID